MCERYIDVAFPVLAPGANVLGGTFDFMELHAPPVVFQSTAKAAPNDVASSILYRAAKNARCWGPVAWYMRGITWGQVLVANRWSPSQTFGVVNGDRFVAAPPDVDFLWLASVSGPVAESVAVNVMAPGGGAPCQGWSHTPLTQQFWLRCPTTVDANPRPYTLHLRLKALTDSNDPTHFAWPL